MISDHPTETARQRAARIWHNYQITKSLQPNVEQEATPHVTEAQLDQITARFRAELREIIQQRTHKSLLHYLIMKRIKRDKPDGK
jgi:predicted ATP-binding protein involved in virulence